MKLINNVDWTIITSSLWPGYTYTEPCRECFVEICRLNPMIFLFFLKYRQKWRLNVHFRLKCRQNAYFRRPWGWGWGRGVPVSSVVILKCSRHQQLRHLTHVIGGVNVTSGGDVSLFWRVMCPTCQYAPTISSIFSEKMGKRNRDP